MSDVALNRQFDVVVLGAGAAGSMAASTVAAHGRTVALVSQFAGATAQSSGAVDGGAAKSLEALQKLVGDLDLTGSTDNTQLFAATEAGTIKATSLVQKTQCLNLSSVTENMKIGVVGFSGLVSFDAQSVAKMLAWSVKQFLGCDLQIAPIHIDLKDEIPWRSSLEMAKSMDKPGSDVRLKEALAHLQGSGAYLTPAVLGRAQYKANWHALQTIAPVFELLGMPHSVPGLRLQDALSKGVIAAGAQVISGEAIGAHLDDNRIVSLEVEGPGGRNSIACKAVILATGRYFSGGFERGGIRRERIFGLPLWSHGKLIEDLPSRQLTSPNMSDAHGLFETSVRTDENLRPYTQTMELFARNLFGAGSGITSSPSLGGSAQSGYECAFHTLKAIEGQ